MGTGCFKVSWCAALSYVALAVFAVMSPRVRAGSIFDDDYKPPPVRTPDHGSSPANPSPQPSPTPAPAPEPTPPVAPRIKPTVQGSQKGSRYPMAIPAKSVCDDADKLVRDVFQDEYAKTTAADHAALGAKLLSEASGEGNDPVTRYVLLRNSIEESESGADPLRALEGIQMLGRFFAVDAQAMKLDALTAASKSSIVPWTAHLMTQSALILSEETLLAGRYDLCVKAAQAAESLSRKSHDPGTMAWASDWVHDADAVADEAQRIAPLLAKVREGKADASANSDVGRFYCLFCGQWERGLPLLAKGADASLKNLAEKELSSADPLSPAQVSLGDLWLDAANMQTGLAKDAAQRRACYWYRLAEPNASGLTRLTLSKRIRDTAFPHMLHGLVAEFYRGRSFNSKRRTRVDSSIDWDWSTYPPEPDLYRERFSVRWSGWLKAPVAGTYKILAQHDDGMRVSIDGRLVIDRWDALGPDSATVMLGTDLVELRVEYDQEMGPAFVGLGWVIPNAKKARAIPITALLHDPIDMSEILPKALGPDRDNTVTLRAIDANIHGSGLNLFDPDVDTDMLAYWNNATDWASWEFSAPPGDYDVSVSTAVQGGPGGGTYLVFVGGVELDGTAADTGGWLSFSTQDLGRIHLVGGNLTLSVKPAHIASEALMNLHAIVLTPAKPE